MRIGIGIGLNKHRPSGSALDGLALDLQFAADKTLTARRGPTPQFTRASTGTFVGSDGLIQSAAINAPRFDHDPITLACRGLLIEEGRTNLALRSEAFDDSYWVKGGAQFAVVTPDNVISPAGSTTAETVTLPAVTSGQYSLVAASFIAKAAPHTFSLYVKSATGGQTVWVSLTPDGTTYHRQQIVLTTGWQRVSVTATLTAGNWFAQFGVDRRDSAQTGTANFEFHAWGAQLEVGAFPTSYIPTTSAAVTRSADVCSISGADFSAFYNRPACTVIASFIPSTIAAPTAICGTNDPRDIEIQMIGGGSIVGLGLDTSLATKQLSRTGVAVGVAQKFAFASESSNQAVCLNNGTVLSSPSWVKNASTPTLFHIGRAGFGGQYTGTISGLRIYRTRLSNEKLQSLTL